MAAMFVDSGADIGFEFLQLLGKVGDYLKSSTVIPHAFPYGIPNTVAVVLE